MMMILTRFVRKRTIEALPVIRRLSPCSASITKDLATLAFLINTLVLELISTLILELTLATASKFKDSNRLGSLDFRLISPAILRDGSFADLREEFSSSCMQTLSPSLYSRMSAKVIVALIYLCLIETKNVCQ